MMPVKEVIFVALLTCKYTVTSQEKIDHSSAWNCKFGFNSIRLKHILKRTCIVRKWAEEVFPYGNIVHSY